MLVTKLQNYFVLLTSFANILKQKMQEIYLAIEPAPPAC